MSVFIKSFYESNFFPDGTMRPSYREKLKENGKTDKQIEWLRQYHTDEYQRELVYDKERRVNNPVTIRQGLTVEEALSEGFIDVDDL